MASRRLLIRLGSMGDVILATAAANALAERHGPHCVDVLVKEEWSSLWAEHPAVSRVWTWKADDRGLGGLRRMIQRLSREGYAEIYDLQASWRTRLLTGMLNPDQIVRPRRWNVARRNLVRWKRWGPPDNFSVRRAFVDAVSPGSHALASVYPSSDAQKRAEALVPRAALALAPGARHATKRWPVERFVEVGRRVARTTGLPVAVVFSPEDQALAERWAGVWPEGSGWIAIQEPLPVVAAVLARVPGLVVNDTGLMHLAAAVGTPVVALFGPTVGNFGFFPSGEGHHIVENSRLPCRPCSLHGGTRCPQGHFRCMLDLSVDEVGRVVSRLAHPPDVGGPTSDSLQSHQEDAPWRD